jgi:hypothetical protein
MSRCIRLEQKQHFKNCRQILDVFFSHSRKKIEHVAAEEFSCPILELNGTKKGSESLKLVNNKREKNKQFENLMEC